MACVYMYYVYDRMNVNFHVPNRLEDNEIINFPHNFQKHSNPIIM